ncbi:nesprin-2-like protein [Lates japonicus]|uniref:Nesprin-2-like protein n=1 Tax=Lates japonicus TaxID=270547 RepID=A0AAD3M9H8_LATJO|nr:nesprin-2-like protein [Lates japonicus]
MASRKVPQFSDVVEHEQIQKRTFTNWINAQLSKRCPPSFVSDLFSDLRDGSQLLDLLEVMSGQSMKRQRGHGVFQQRANIETALNFLKKKSIKLVNINIPDIIDGRPSIILGLVWTIILRCHIEELASALSFSSRHSSLDSLSSLDSWSGSPVPASPVPAGRTSPLHRRFRISAKKALLMWVRDQCQRVGCSVSVKDFKSSWRSGEVFWAILCSLRPQLVDLSLVQSRSNQENLEEAFHLAERELHIPRLLEPQDVDVKDPDEKSIMTYVAQFLQYSNDMPAPDDYLQVSPSERAQEVTCWLEQAFQELSEAWTAAQNSSYAEKYRVFQSLAGSFTEQRRPVMTLLTNIKRCPELSREQQALRAAWDRMEEELQRCKADLDLSLPPPLDSVVAWLQRAEAALTEEGGRVKDHAGAAKEARAQQDTLKTLIKEMSHHVQILDNYHNMDGSGNVLVPLEKFDEIKRRVTHVRVTAKYQGIKLEYQEYRHTVLDLLKRINAKIQTWKTPYRSKEAVYVLLQDWHETVERQGIVLILMDSLQILKEKANAYTSKAALGADSQLVNRQVKEAESEAELVTQAVTAMRGMMERVVSAWETYNKCLVSLQTWLSQTAQSQTQSAPEGTQDMSEWMSCQAKLNEVGNLVIEVTETSTSCTLAEQLSKVNMQWAERMKRTKFEVSSEPSVGPTCLQTVHSLTQEASLLLRQPLDVASVPLRANRQKLQLLSKKMTEVDMSSADFQRSCLENFQQTLPQVLAEAERTCGELQRAASRLEGRLAELERWITDALDCHQHLKEKEKRGHSVLDSAAKGLISRGLQLENQVVMEGQELQDFVAQVQKTSPLQSLSTSGLQDRITKAVSHCQEILGMFSSLGFKRHMGEAVHQTQRKPETGLFVVAKTKHVDQTGNVKLQTQDPSQLSPQAVMDEAASAEERVESLRALCETVTPSESSCLATDLLKESDEAQETQPSDSVLPAHSRGRQLGGNTPLSATGMLADPQPSSSLLQEQREDSPQRDLSPAAGEVPVHGDNLPLRSQDAPTERPVLKSSLRAQEKPLKARLLHITKSSQQVQPHIQAVVRGDTVEAKQEAEWTVVPEAVAPSQEEHPAEQEVLERYRKSSLIFQSQLQNNKQHLEEFIPEPVTVSTLQNQKKQLQILKQETEALWFEFELQYAQLSQSPHLMTREDLSEVQRDWEQLTQEWRSQQMCLKNRMTSLENTADLMESADDHLAVITQKLDTIIAESMNISSFNLPDLSLQSDLKALHSSVSHLKQLRQQLEKVQLAAQAVDHFLATVREVKAEIPAPLANQDASRQQNEADWEQERHSWHSALQQRLQTAAEQSEKVDSNLKAAGMTLSMDGATVTCQDVVTLEQCCILTELLKMFQSTRAELSGTLQRAESTISEQASYMGKDNLQRLHTKVQETKAELNGLGDGIEEVRSVCRQLHAHLRKIPGCSNIPFESEADTLMDSWLDISERTDSHLENLHRSLTLWDGVLQLGAEVECWTDNKLTEFAQSPSFQSEDDIKTLQNEIMAQEKSVERFQQRASEIQSLLQSTEPPLELQELCWQLQTQDEQAESLLEDLRVLTCIASPDSLQSLSADGIQLQERIRTSHRLFSEVEEQTQRNIQDLDRLEKEGEDLKRWLQTAEEKAAKEEDLTLLQEEALTQRVRTELLNQLVSSLQSSNLRQSALVEESSKLLERYHNFYTSVLHVAEERQCPLSRDVEVFQALSKSIQSWVGDLRQLVDSLLGESPCIQSPVEQRLHCAQAVVRATADGEARLQELRVAGNSLSHRLCDGEDLKQEIQETIQRIEEQWTELLQSVEPYHKVLQTDPELISSYLSGRQEVCCRVEELQRQITQLPTSFPCPGTAERRQACLLAHQLCDKSESLQLTLTSLAEQRRELAERSSDTIWKDSSWAELDTCCSSLMAELKVLLQEVTDTEKDILQLETLKDSIADSATVEARVSLSQQVSDLQDHKRALDSSIRENLALLKESNNQRVQQVKEEISSVHTAVKDLADNIGNLCDDPEVSPGISQLKQHWCSIQGFDTRLTELAARVDSLQKTGESSVTREMLPADVTLTVDAVAKDLDSLRSIFPQKTQECAENAAKRVRQLIRQLQHWSQTVQAESPSLSQATAADTAESAGAGHAEMAEEENTEEASDPEGPEPKHSEVPERQDDASLLREETESTLPPASLEEAEVTQGQPQMQESMEPEWMAPGLSAGLGAGERTGGSPVSYKHTPTMQDILSEIQSLVERSNIINRTPHIDLNWYLKSSPGEAEIRLVRTVQQVLACRYQPAQLDVTAMAKQLEEAEEYRCCVQEQVASMKSMSAARVCDPNALERAEGQWSAALLDASATVQVKAAQLDQVKQCHKQMKMARAFLEVLAAEKEKTSLNALGSSAAQADKLHALLQTMELKKNIMEELLHLSSQLSVHLSDAESSGALLAQLGDVQEEWRLLEGSIKRALRHAVNSTSQASLLIKEAEQLKAKLEALQNSNFQSNDSKSALELVCLTTDLKLYNQLYLNLQSQADALIHFSLGQKEKDEIQCSLKELGSLLNVTKRKLDASTYSCGGISSSKMNKQLEDLIIWAKQAENHISTGKKLALFPEEARIQIVDMRKFQTDILSRRSKMQVQVEEMKDVASDMEKEESDQVLKTVEDLYEAIADSLDHVLDTMKKHLHQREKLLSQLASMDAWLAETHAMRDPCAHVENVSKADIQKLESELESHKSATAEIQSQLNLVEAMAESFKDISVGLSPGESRYLVNRLSGLWTELDGLLAHEKATSWELEELIHERTSSDEELSTIQDSLKQITADLEQQKFPSTHKTLLTVAHLKHMLMENQCQVQELQHCHEAKRSTLLYTIGELQDRCKALSLGAFEQDKYQHLRRQMEESRDIAKEQIQRANDKTLSVGERFRLCQTLLVELPLVKTQCQEAGDQLEAVAQELHPSELNSERHRIQRTVETLVSWEHSVTADVKNLETKLLLGLRFSSELPALIEFFQRTREELEQAEPVTPDEKAIDSALRRYWVMWRNMESGMRVLEALGRKEKINLKNCKELYSLRDAAMQECHLRMESLSQARESLKDYQWAAQGAIAFLHNAEATFLSAPGGFLDCTEEQRQTQQALEALEDGFQAHICHLVELVPQQPCLSRPKAEQLHISILSQLLVGRAVLEAQAQLRLESLQSLAGKIEELTAGCPMQGCGVGKDGELGALWRRWVSLRRGLGLLMAHTEQRQEEWKDITTSIEQCCSFLASLQAEVPDSSTVSFTQEKPQELLAQAEMHQAGLEQEQQALASLEHRLEHALSLSSSQDPASPGPVGKTLVKIQENVRRKDLSSQKAKLKSIMDSVQTRYAEISADISKRLQEVQLSLQRAEVKLIEASNPVRKMAGRVEELGSGLQRVNTLLEQKSPTVSEAQNVLKRVWDELDAWHSRLMLLESEVQDLAEEQPDHAHLLMDQLTQPLQLYQNASQMAEQRTSFLSKIPACLQEFEDILHSAACWLDEAQSWLSAPCSFTTARSLKNHANSLQLVLDDSERIRHALQDFRLVLAEISAVCDISTQEERLDQNDQQVCKMQHNVLEPLEQLLQTAGAVEAMETELKTMEKNVPKIRIILSSMDNSNIPLTEHLHNRQVILANVQSMRKTLEDMERCKGELRLPQGAEESLLVFSRARLLLQPLEELEQLTQEQTSVLENKIREEEVTGQALSITTVSSIPEEIQQQGRSPQRLLVQELESLAHASSPEVESSLKAAESELLSVTPGSDTIDFGSKNVEPGLVTVDSKADVGDSSHPKLLMAEPPLITAVTPAAEGQFTAPAPAAAAATLDQHQSPKHKAFNTDPHTKPPQAAAAIEDTRLIPTRPITPFTRELAGFIEEGDEDLSLPTAPHQDLDTVNGLKEQIEVRSGQNSLVEESQQAQESSKVPLSLTEHEDDKKEQQRWSRLHSQISQKLTTLKKVQDEHQTHEKVKSTDGSHPGVKEELYEAVRRVLLCLDACTDLLLTPGGAGEDDPRLRLLQQECVSAELVTLAELLNKVESDTRPVLSKEEPDAYHCLTRLHDCLRTVQLVFTSSSNQLTEHLSLKNQHQEFFNQLCILDEFDLGQSETFPSIKDAPGLEQCVLGRHLRESPGEKAKLQQASQSLLQGITHLLELGEECITERQMSQVHSRSQLQAVLSRHKKLLQVLGSQLAFVQHLFRREPEVLKCQEDERLQLEVRAKALQQQALEQEVASQRRLQEWTLWEDNCGRLGRVLDECEALISSGEPEGDDEEESVLQLRLDACQQTLAQLDESRAALGLLLDQCKVLQTEPAFAASVGQAGGALELRWRSAFRRTEQEVQRCRDIQNMQARFQKDFASVSKWLVSANKHLKTWSDLAESSDLNQECLHNSLIKLLDFSMEVEAMSVQRASVSRAATQLLHLREADCPRLRAQIAQLEVNWTQHTSDLSKIQDQLHQRLLDGWPPVELLSDLEDWLKKQEARLIQEKETLLKAKDAAQITDVLQHYRELKAGVVSGQLLLDFLCQSGPQAVGADVQSLRSERTMFAEKLGALRLQWLHLQRELESQIRGAEQIHRTCAVRERQLQHLHGWIEQQKEQLNQWEQPTSQTLAQKALLEWEAVVGRVKEVAAALQGLKSTRAYVEKEEEHPCDIAFSNQAESVSRACEDLSQQMETLRPALQQTVAEWSSFDRDLTEVTLQASRVRCALQHQRAPLFSLKQAEGYMDLLQQLQEKAGKGEELLAAVEKSFQCLAKTLHCRAAQALSDQMEGERKRWKDVIQELKDEQVKTGQTLSLWQEYSHLSESCSLHLRHLWRQWEELSISSLAPEQGTQAVIHSVEKLQDVAENLQSSVGDMLEASKPLTGLLEPVAANLIQSDTRLLSRDILLLSQAMSGKKKSLKEDLEEQKLFHTSLQTLEKQTQNLQHKLKAGLNDKNSVEQVLLELSDLLPSLVDVSEMSGYLTLNEQEAERLHMLIREWMESMTRTSDINRELQAEHQSSQTFQEKCKTLMHMKEKLEESMPKKPQSYSSLQEMLTVHQRLQAEVITAGHQLLQGLLCEAVKSMEKETGERRSGLMAQVSSVRESWFSAVALAAQWRSWAKEQLRQQRIYHRGSKLLRRLLRDVDPLLPPAGPALCTLQQLRSCADDHQCVEEALGLHSAVYNQTLEAGKHLSETMTESESRSRLQSELQDLEEAWKRTTSLLRRRRDLVNTTVQTWSQCQDGITNIMSDLDEMKTRTKQLLPEKPDDSKKEKLIQEIELSLQRLSSGLRELGTMKTDLSQYIAAGDSALLEQQLEQLHGQWEELCMKVSLRRQEIADRLNAWTIFNDKNKEFCDWLTQMENKVCHSGDLSIEEMVEKLKKDCIEEINLFSENKSHLKQLGEQLLLASDEAKQTQVHGSLQEVNQRWHSLFRQIEARVKKLKETLVTVQQLDKNMSNLRSWLSRIEAELSRPITYSVCHHQEIQRRLAEQQELQRDIEQHTEGVASVLSLCDVLLRDEDATGGTEAESDSLQETSRSLDQRWRTICAMALDRRLRIEETWRLWCKFLDDYSRFEDWLKMAERTAANPNSADVLYTVAKEELKKFEGFQRQVHERLTQLELVNNQYRRLARENRTDRASQLKAMVHEGNRRWDTLHRRVAAILRRLKYFTSQREEFEGTRESMLVWLTELDLQLTNVEHFSESDVHHKIQQLNSFQKEITLNTERIDGLIVFGEGLIQKSSPQDAALIEDELEELHTYCQEVFSRLVRFHQRLSQPPIIIEEPELSSTTFSLESSLELIGRPWLGRSQGSLPATPTHLLPSPLERSGRETPVSVDSLPLEWDHTGDVGGSSSHEDDEEEEEHEEEGAYFSALSEVELTKSQQDFVEAPEALRASSLAPSRSMVVHESPGWGSATDLDTQPLQGHTEAAPTLTSTPLKQGYLRLMSQCSGSIEDIKRVSLILDDDEQPKELGLTGLTSSDKQSGGRHSKKGSSTQRERREASPPRSFFYRVLRAAFPLHLLLLLLLLLPCLIPMSESDPSCTVTNNFARSFYPMLRYTNGPPPTR